MVALLVGCTAKPPAGEVERLIQSHQHQGGCTWVRVNHLQVVNTHEAPPGLWTLDVRYDLVFDLSLDDLEHMTLGSSDGSPEALKAVGAYIDHMRREFGNFKEQGRVPQATQLVVARSGESWSLKRLPTRSPYSCP